MECHLATSTFYFEYIFVCKYILLYYFSHIVLKYLAYSMVRKVRNAFLWIVNLFNIIIINMCFLIACQLSTHKCITTLCIYAFWSKLIAYSPKTLFARYNTHWTPSSHFHCLCHVSIIIFALVTSCH